MKPKPTKGAPSHTDVMTVRLIDAVPTIPPGLMFRKLRASPESSLIDVYGPEFQLAGRASRVSKLNGVHGELGDGVGDTLGEALGDALDEATWREIMRVEPITESWMISL